MGTEASLKKLNINQTFLVNKNVHQRIFLCLFKKIHNVVKNISLESDLGLNFRFAN